MRELIANRPWILIVLGFLLLISVWTFFFVVALHNQPEHLPLSQRSPVPPETGAPGSPPPWT